VFVAIYAKDPFPQDDSRIVNSGKFWSKNSALEWLFVKSKNHPLDFWHPQILDTATGEYEHVDMKKVIFS
jgi:hypothetical protein